MRTTQLSTLTCKYYPHFLGFSISICGTQYNSLSPGAANLLVKCAKSYRVIWGLTYWHIDPNRIVRNGIIQNPIFLADFFLHFLKLFCTKKTIKMKILTSVWSVQHPNTGRNIHHWICARSSEMKTDSPVVGPRLEKKLRISSDRIIWGGFKRKLRNSGSMS